MFHFDNYQFIIIFLRIHLCHHVSFVSLFVVVVVVLVLRLDRDYFAQMEMSALLVKLRTAKFRPMSTSLSCHTCCDLGVCSLIQPTNQVAFYDMQRITEDLFKPDPRGIYYCKRRMFSSFSMEKIPT